MDCNSCKEREKHVDPVPYIVHETEMARAERGQKRWFIIALVLAVFLFVSNGWWVWRESQLTTETKEVSQEVDTGDGDAIVTGIVRSTSERFISRFPALYSLLINCAW